MKDLTYVSMEIEGVGGGCTALRKNLPDGTVLIVSDGNCGHDMTGEWATPSAVIYASEDAWQSQDPCPLVREWYTDAEKLLVLVNDYLRETFPAPTEAIVNLDDDTALKLRLLASISLIVVDILELDEDGTVIDTTPSVLTFDFPAAKRLADALVSLVES